MLNHEYRQQCSCTEAEDAYYVRGLREGIDIGLVRGIEKGMERGAQLKSSMIKRKLAQMNFPEPLIREILGASKDGNEKMPVAPGNGRGCWHE